MLTLLKVSNFAIAKEIEIQFDRGMTVLTGETGAGKSIVLDALGLALGDRADTSMVREGEAKAEISAVFDLSQMSESEQWLIEHDLDADQQCILRRIVTSEGRSRSYINGHPCSLTQMKQIGEQLIDIHSQHAHQSLLRKDSHREILDDFGDLKELSDSVKHAHRDWSQKNAKLLAFKADEENLIQRKQMLDFQVNELDELSLVEGELSNLEKEQAQLANADQLLHQAQLAFSICDNEETSAVQLIRQALQALQTIGELPTQLNEAAGLLSEAEIQVTEAASSIQHFTEKFERNPERLQEIDDRLSACYQLARKHHCQPEDILEIHQKLRQELNELSSGSLNADVLEHDAKEALNHYLELGEQQRARRKEVSAQLTKKIDERLAEMGMKSTRLSVDFSAIESEAMSPHGLDHVEFLISTNKGQSAKSLAKVASGGELSRISLAIQVVIAERSTLSTMVFDEVDVGIGGATAEIVGRLLRQLAHKGQIICVTHLPQVAALGHHHFFISKSEDQDSVRSSIESLGADERIKEVARMLGGVEITESTLAHAEEMLET